MPTNNVTLVANYVANAASTYTVSYDANGGSGAPSSQTKIHEENLVLSGTIPTREGYSFLGWSTSSSATSAEYIAGGNFAIDADTTLYAVWSISSYTLTVTPGGTTYGGNYNSTQEITAPSVGYTITYNYNGSEQSNTTETANRLFTNWSTPETGSISDLTASTTSYTFGAGNETITANYGTVEVVILPEATRDGYNHLGWSTNSSSVEAEYNAGENYTATEDITLYAIWEENPEWNTPVLSEGMIPVKWDTTYNNWITTDEENWDYNYDLASAWNNSIQGDGTAKWANIMLTDGLSYYNNGSEGDTTTVSEGDTVPAGKVIATQGSSYVWIPRFTYHTEDGNSVSWNSDATGTKTARTYILFSNDTEDYTTDLSGETAYTYNKHSAFTLTDASGNITEITGFWMGKYEASQGENAVPESKPQVSCWSNITINFMYRYAKDLNNTNTSIGAHMVKNSEWGAVALLTSAKGRIPYINNNNLTGYAGENQDAKSVDNSYRWNTKKGVRGSTTHNIYGIYDMSGESNEYTSGYTSNTAAPNAYTNFTTSYNTHGNKYVDVYTSSTFTGDHAVLGWDSDNASSSVTSMSPVIFRSGGFSVNTNEDTGIFYSASSDGSGELYTGFRVALFGTSL